MLNDKFPTVLVKALSTLTSSGSPFSDVELAKRMLLNIRSSREQIRTARRGSIITSIFECTDLKCLILPHMNGYYAIPNPTLTVAFRASTFDTFFSGYCVEADTDDL